MPRLYWDTIELGDPVAPLSKPAVTRVQIAKFAGAAQDWSPLHIDDDFAKSAGYGSVFAHGATSMGQGRRGEPLRAQRRSACRRRCLGGKPEPRHRHEGADHLPALAQRQRRKEEQDALAAGLTRDHRRASHCQAGAAKRIRRPKGPDRSGAGPSCRASPCCRAEKAEVTAAAATGREAGTPAATAAQSSARKGTAAEGSPRKGCQGPGEARTKGGCQACGETGEGGCQASGEVAGEVASQARGQKAARQGAGEARQEAREEEVVERHAAHVQRPGNGQVFVVLRPGRDRTVATGSRIADAVEIPPCRVAGEVYKPWHSLPASAKVFSLATGSLS